MKKAVLICALLGGVPALSFAQNAAAPAAAVTEQKRQFSSYINEIEASASRSRPEVGEQALRRAMAAMQEQTARWKNMSAGTKRNADADTKAAAADKLYGEIKQMSVSFAANTAAIVERLKAFEGML